MTVSLNGTALEQIAYSGEPYENEYTQMIGEASNYLCYKVPSELLKAGGNTLTVKMTSGQSITLCFVELTVA